MAKMLVSPANFLLLDEPTNHLDLRAKDVLLEAISAFSGTVLFVSHDRYFIDGLATRVFEVEDRRLHIYPGNYEDYLFRKQGGIPTNTAEAKAKLTRDSATNAHIDPATGMFKEVKQVGAMGVSPRESEHEIEGSLEPVSAPPNPKPHVKRLNPIKLKQIEDRVAAIEEEMPQLEDRIAQAGQQQAVFTTADAAVKLAAELDTMRDRHAALTAEWEELGMQLEEQATA
jgi:ATP-binding cassette subfamily F protein 3